MTPTPPQGDPERELRDCFECGRKYDLSKQYYYGPKCPECMKEQGDEERTWPSCTKCGDRVDPDEATMVKVRGAARDPAWVRLPACPECAEDHTPRKRGAPY